MSSKDKPVKKSSNKLVASSKSAKSTTKSPTKSSNKVVTKKSGKSLNKSTSKADSQLKKPGKSSLTRKPSAKSSESKANENSLAVVEKSSSKKVTIQNDPCGRGPDIYTHVLGPTADETILAGLLTFMKLCQECPATPQDVDSGTGLSTKDADETYMNANFAARDTSERELTVMESNGTLLPKESSSRSVSIKKEPSERSSDARQQEELEQKQQEEAERKRQEELEKEQQEELERRRQEELEREQQEELERRRQEEIERQYQEELEKQRQELLELQRLEELQREEERLQELSENKKSSYSNKQPSMRVSSQRPPSLRESSFKQIPSSYREMPSIQESSHKEHASRESSHHQPSSIRESSVNRPPSLPSKYSEVQKEESEVLSLEDEEEEGITEIEAPVTIRSEQRVSGLQTSSASTSQEAQTENTETRHDDVQTSSMGETGSSQTSEHSINHQESQTQQPDVESSTSQTRYLRSVSKTAKQKKQSFDSSTSSSRLKESGDSGTCCHCLRPTSSECPVMKGVKCSCSASKVKCQQSVPRRSCLKSTSKCKCSSSASSKGSFVTSPKRHVRVCCDCTNASSVVGQQKKEKAIESSPMGDTNELKVRYAITKITKFCNYTTFEVMRSTSKKPKVMPKSLEGVFVLRNGQVKG